MTYLNLKLCLQKVDFLLKNFTININVNLMLMLLILIIIVANIIIKTFCFLYDSQLVQLDNISDFRSNINHINC